MIPAEVIMKLATLGLDEKQAEAVATMLADVEAATLSQAEEGLEKSREKARARWRKWKDNQSTNVSQRLQTTANVSKRLRAHVEDNSSTNNTSGKKEDTSPPARSRGTRIPDDFSPDIDAATSEGLSRADAEREARSFVDYWRARPGKEALKMDWPATWRVWFRRRLETPKSTAPPRKLTQGESIRNMAREKGVIDDTGSPVRRLEASHRDGENPGTGDVIRLAIAGNHRW